MIIKRKNILINLTITCKYLKINLKIFRLSIMKIEKFIIFIKIWAFNIMHIANNIIKFIIFSILKTMLNLF